MATPNNTFNSIRTQQVNRHQACSGHPANLTLNTYINSSTQLASDHICASRQHYQWCEESDILAVLSKPVYSLCWTLSISHFRLQSNQISNINHALFPQDKTHTRPWSLNVSKLNWSKHHFMLQTSNKLRVQCQTWNKNRIKQLCASEIAF